MYSRCKIFTPPSVVDELLNTIGYTSNLYGKKIMENSCGDGNILMEVVRRYILDAILQNKTNNEIRLGLQSDVYGVEIDEEHYQNCINNLDSLAGSFNIINVRWKIIKGDFLKEDYKIFFDFVIGNPPYINYRDLTEETRTFLREKYESCRYGKFDYCYAFIEASIKYLNQTGKMSYLIPSSIFKNVYAQNLREIILEKTVKIIDYTTQNLFDRLTSSAILICDNGSKIENIEYIDIVNEKKHYISKKNLNGKWVFSNLNEKDIGSRRFGDYFTASYSVATLYNAAYVLKDAKEEGEYFVTGKNKIEKGIIREAASPRALNYNKSEFIIFPYKYTDETLTRYTLDDFEKRFPEVTKYLKKYLDKLAVRKSDNGIEWYEYGRSQALAHLNQPKLLLSTVVTKEVKVYELSKESIPYSGIYIIPKKDIPLNIAKEILENDNFYTYVKNIGINANGSSLRITAGDINNYMF